MKAVILTVTRKNIYHCPSKTKQHRLISSCLRRCDLRALACRGTAADADAGVDLQRGVVDHERRSGARRDEHLYLYKRKHIFECRPLGAHEDAMNLVAKRCVQGAALTVGSRAPSPASRAAVQPCGERRALSGAAVWRGPRAVRHARVAARRHRGLFPLCVAGASNAHSFILFQFSLLLTGFGGALWEVARQAQMAAAPIARPELWAAGPPPPRLMAI